MILPLENGLNGLGLLGSAVRSGFGSSLGLGNFGASGELEEFDNVADALFAAITGARFSQSIGLMLKSCAAPCFTDSGVAHISEVLGDEITRRVSGPSGGLLALSNDRCCRGG